MHSDVNNPQHIEIKDFNYVLPDSYIAKHPLEQRDNCKLLMRDRSGNISDNLFYELPHLLPEKSLLVYNNTRVINARLKFRKESGGVIEIFCLEPTSPSDYEQSFASTKNCCWSCLIGNAKRWKEGSLSRSIHIDSKDEAVVLTASRTGKIGEDGSPEVKFEWTGDISFSEIISAAGEIPIPPYLNRASEYTDQSDYQTIFSRVEGSVAAPTAGLHFTDEILKELDQIGVKRGEVTLHVGAGTFRPVKSKQIGDHEMHSEFISVKLDFIKKLASTIHSGQPVIAVGTTCVRTLESLYYLGKQLSEGNQSMAVNQWSPYENKGMEPFDISPEDSLKCIVEYLEAEDSDRLEAYTRIIIAPGYKYNIVSGMITNFHQPQSTLLLLVSAFIGDDWKKVYEHALKNDYRFLSYGDACLFF